MTKKEFLELYSQYCADTLVLSFIKLDHPAYIKLAQAGDHIIPWVLQRLKDSIGHDHGDAMDRDNSPWLSISLLCDLTNEECLNELPEDGAGNLLVLRPHLLKWGEAQGLITTESK